MAITDRDTTRLLALAIQLFPRENAQRLSLVRDVLKAHYEPKVAEAVIRSHATANNWLDVPALGTELQMAHQDRGTELEAIRAQAAKEVEAKREADRRGREAAAAYLASLDATLQLAGWRRVRSVVRRLLGAHPFLKNQWAKRGLRGSLIIKSHVAGELAKAVQPKEIR